MTKIDVQALAQRPAAPEHYPTLLSPMTLRGFELRNRVVVAPMFQFRPITEPAGVAWYRRMAAGGSAMVIVEGVKVHRFADDLTADMLRPLADAIREEGALAVVQVGLSVVGDWMDPHEIPHDQVLRAIEEFAQAARVLRDAGFDGIQPHGAHAFLLGKFFMPEHNHRTDEFGGDSLENRGRLGLEIVRSIRKAVGDDLLLLYRHSPVGDEHTLEESLTFTGWLKEAGLDLLDLSPAHENEVADLCPPFREKLDIPVIAVGEMEDPVKAETALAENRCDLVALGRQLIADAAWPNKIAAGEISRITFCDKCGDGCYGRVKMGQPVYCKQWDADEVKPFLPAG
ncbi:MAG: hypothetical protein ACLFV3_12730 [Phycisphaeraceae bacterium]